MCCRISTSSPCSRVIAGLYILLATFLIGFFAVQSISWLDSLTLFESENADLMSAVDGPKESSCFDNKDGITLIRWFGGPYKDHEREIGVMNDGGESIYYTAGSLVVDESKSGSVVYTLYNPELFGDPGLSNTEAEIKPNDSTDFSLPPDDDYSMKVTFTYRLGEARSWRSITVHFGEGAQFGDGCIDHF